MDDDDRESHRMTTSLQPGASLRISFLGVAVPDFCSRTQLVLLGAFGASKSVERISDEASGSYDEAAGRWTSRPASFVLPC